MLSIGKIGRKLSMQKSDVRDHQASATLDDLALASKDMQDMRNCYDCLLAAAAATANSIYEFSESLNEMGNCLLGKTAAVCDSEKGNVLTTLGNLQLELQKIADTYRSYVIVTITNPAESLLSELLKVEEMKLQCQEKREVYDHMMAQHREKRKLKNGKFESSIAQKLQEAQDEYDEMARLCVFRVKSLKDGQWHSLLTQAARHHAAQLNFFRKGLKAVEAVEPLIRNVAEKHHIDCQLRGLFDRGSQEGEPMSGHEIVNDGDLSFDYKQKKQGLDDDDTSPNPMELDPVDFPYSQASILEDSEINQNRHKGEQLFGRQTRVSSYSAPLYPEKTKASEKLKETQPAPKSYSYVLPPPVVDTRNPILKPATSLSHSTSSAALTSKAQSTIKTINNITPSIQLPSPATSTGRFSFSQRDSYYRTDGSKVDKQQSYSGPLPPSKQFSFKIASNSSGPITGPITSTELPHPPSRAPVSQPNLSNNTSPPSLSSPKISELHELPRPPPSSLAFSKPIAISGGLSRHSAPLLSKNQDISPPNKRAMLTSSTCASPLPLPPSVVKFNSSKSGT
ncbi:uncharacterized protein At2g33490 [Helianthus annuus]|uniref:Putative arfaptin homology (AH) domain/BAR domain protein n=1 Tax=Helianthus annuus TaxID=4232 RepID=A0A251S7E7_HELAN|nr:uncharacterized protein At2g33490 [Helianthus annuus]XP_022011605.1 uncharacterized protein At2g33490 [Helianthus annuus]